MQKSAQGSLACLELEADLKLWQTQQDLRILNKTGKILAMLTKPNWPLLVNLRCLPKQIDLLVSPCVHFIRRKFYTLTSLLGCRYALWYWKFWSANVAHFFSLAAESGHNLVAYPQWLEIDCTCCSENQIRIEAIYWFIKSSKLTSNQWTILLGSILAMQQIKPQH